MGGLELLRRRTLCQLRDAYAAGHIRTGTLEHRIEATLGAHSPLALHEATWDLPSIGGSLRQVLDSLLHGGSRSQPCRRMLFWLPAPLSIAFDDEPRTWLLGRSRACDITLPDPAISRRHALLSTRGGLCAIRDLDSTNGLHVNGVRVSTAALRPGDEVSFAGTLIADVR